MNNWTKLLLGLVFLMLACTPEQKDLPYLGHRDTKERIVEGKTVTDTIYHQIPDFHFVNQDSNSITPATFEDQIYVADFFFTFCPTICPTVKAQMLRVYEKYPDILFLSHTLAPKQDSVAALHSYAKKLGIDSKRWHMVTGDKKEIYDIAKQYFIAAAEGDQYPGGITHSGGLVLVDKNKNVRGIYDGTEPKKVDELIKDLGWLIENQKLPIK